MDKYLFVGRGGFIGVVLRYGLSGYIQQAANSTLFPLGTLVVNVLGCFGIGYLLELAEERQVVGDGSRLLRRSFPGHTF